MRLVCCPHVRLTRLGALGHDFQPDATYPWRIG